jgi:hypothetical protein
MERCITQGKRMGERLGLSLYYDAVSVTEVTTCCWDNYVSKDDFRAG